MAIGAISNPNEDLVAAEAALDAAFGVPLSCISPDERSERLVALHRIEAKVDALLAAATESARASSLSTTSGQRNTANHMASIANVDPAAVRADERRGKWLRDFPAVAEAFQRGEITSAHVEKMRLADDARFHHLMMRDEEMLLNSLRTCHFRDLDQVFNEWLLGADPDGQLPKEDTPKTYLDITPLPGGFSKVSGVLDPLQTQVVENSLELEMTKLRKEEQACDSRRTVGNRRLTALLRLLARGARRKDGTFPIPLINLSVSQKVAENTLARLADPSIEPVAINRHDPDARCHRIDGTPIHPMYALAAMAIGQFRRTVYSATGKPIETSVKSRTFPNWMKDILSITTNGHCANPVCDAPFHWLHADHITPHSHSEDTSLDNGQMLCEPENLWKGDDPTRARFERPIAESAGPDQVESEDPQEVLELTELAKERVRRLLGE